MYRKIKCGLIGCGTMGYYRSESLMCTEEVELIACADVNPSAYKLAIKNHGYKRGYLDYKEMLSKENLEAVIVVTSHDQLQPIAMAAVKAGKYVFIETPMALSAAEGRKLVDAAEGANVRLMVGCTFRYMPERILMKKLLDSGTIGELVHVLSGQLIGPMVKAQGWGSWCTNPSQGGGPLFRIGPHVIDQILWMTPSKPIQVYAQAKRQTKDSVEESIFLTIRFANGMISQICTSQQVGCRYGWIDLLGSKGRMRAEWERRMLYIQSSIVDAYQHPTSVRVPWDGTYLPKVADDKICGKPYLSFGLLGRDSDTRRMWVAEMVEFITAIKENRKSAILGEAGVCILEVIDAALQSVQTGNPVDLK